MSKDLDAITKFLSKNISKSAFSFWEFVIQEVPEVVWELPSSSSGKYHLDIKGQGHSVGEHTLEMLNAGAKVISLLNVRQGDRAHDAILLAIALHDAAKYGMDGKRIHTTNDHDVIMASWIKEKARDWFDNFSLEILVSMIYMHAGRWCSASNDYNKLPTFSNYTFFIHMLDMLSSRRTLVSP